MRTGVPAPTQLGEARLVADWRTKAGSALAGHAMITLLPEALMLSVGGGPAETISALNWSAICSALSSEFHVASSSTSPGFPPV